MAVNEIKVNTARLRTDSEQIKQRIKTMKKQLEDMVNSVNQLNQMWEGESKNAFVRAFEDDRKAAVQVLKELESLNNYEVKAKDKYEQCEKQIESIIASIKV